MFKLRGTEFLDRSQRRHLPLAGVAAVVQIAVGARLIQQPVEEHVGALDVGSRLGARPQHPPRVHHLLMLGSAGGGGVGDGGDGIELVDGSRR